MERNVVSVGTECDGGHDGDEQYNPVCPPSPSGSGYRPSTPRPDNVFAMRPNLTLMSSQMRPGYNTASPPTPIPTSGLYIFF